MAKRHTVEFNAKITPVKPLNNEFTLCKCYVMALDKNRNLSYIGKNAAETALPTLFNIPVIGHLYVDEDGQYRMGGHDMVLAQDEQGQLMFKSLCVPYGVVPQQDNIHYEDVAEPNGDVHTYIVSDVILWTGRFPELREAIYSDDTYFGQSMEINVDEREPLEEDKNYTNILKYTYSALCLLGKSDNPEFHTEPCFPMSRVEPYEFSPDNDKFSELMKQLKTELAFCFENAGKGEQVEETIELENEHTQDGVEEIQPEETIPEPVEEIVKIPAETPVEIEETCTEVEVYAATYEEKRDAIREALPYTESRDENGDVIYHVSFWLCDFDDAFAYVERNDWSPANGHSETKGRFAYTFNETEKTAFISGDFEEMIVKWLTKEEATQIEESRKHYEELIKYKASREKADREAEYDAAISEFVYLEDNDEYRAVYKNRYSYESVEALKNACYIIKGKYSIVAPQKKSVSTEPIIPVGNSTTPPASLHERFHARFGKK